MYYCDTLSEDYRQGKTVLKIAKNGSQKFIIKNKDSKVLDINVNLFSDRFQLMKSLPGSTKDETWFIARLPPKHAVIFEIKDMGHEKYSTEGFPEDGNFEGSLQIRFGANDGSVRFLELHECHDLPVIVLELDPPSDSYKQYRKVKDGNIETLLVADDHKNPLNKLISVEVYDEKKEKEKKEYKIGINNLYAEVEELKAKRLKEKNENTGKSTTEKSEGVINRETKNGNNSKSENCSKSLMDTEKVTKSAIQNSEVVTKTSDPTPDVKKKDKKKKKKCVIS